jgi:hypothetical protein
MAAHKLRASQASLTRGKGRRRSTVVSCRQAWSPMRRVRVESEVQNDSCPSTPFGSALWYPLATPPARLPHVTMMSPTWGSFWRADLVAPDHPVDSSALRQQQHHHGR